MIIIIIISYIEVIQIYCHQMSVDLSQNLSESRKFYNNMTFQRSYIILYIL